MLGIIDGPDVELAQTANPQFADELLGHHGGFPLRPNSVGMAIGKRLGDRIERRSPLAGLFVLLLADQPMSANVWQELFALGQALLLRFAFSFQESLQSREVFSACDYGDVATGFLDVFHD